MKHLFRTLLRFYPRSFRCDFSEEMLATFEHLQREAAELGPIHAALFTCREFIGLLYGLVAEHVRFELCSSANDARMSTRTAFLRDSSSLTEIAELKQCVRFHLSQTIYCIANHRFEGARFHADEEDRARAKLRVFEAVSRRIVNEVDF